MLSDPSIDPQFIPKELPQEVFDYQDDIKEHTINDMRIRAHQRAIVAQREKARKAKIAKLGSEDEDSQERTKDKDLMKKDMLTTDHDGKVLPIKAIRPESLPSMAPTGTKS